MTFVFLQQIYIDYHQAIQDRTILRKAPHCRISASHPHFFADFATHGSSLKGGFHSLLFRVPSVSFVLSPASVVLAMKYCSPSSPSILCSSLGTGGCFLSLLCFPLFPAPAPCPLSRYSALLSCLVQTNAYRSASNSLPLSKSSSGSPRAY